MSAAAKILRRDADAGKARAGRTARAGASRKRPVKGATRNMPAVKKSRKGPSVWVNRVLILLGAGVVLAALAQAYNKVQSIPVQQVVVTGELEYIRTEALQAMVQPALAGGFLNADLQHMRQKLEALPWVYEATVRRRWPNALEIHVIEQLPIARWGGSGFINHEGDVFTPSDVQGWQELPVLRGPEGKAKALMASYQRVIEILGPLELAVEQLAMDERAQLEAVLEGGMQVLVGRQDFRERMNRFVTIYRSELVSRPGEVERVDLRYESGVAVAFNEPPEVVENQKQDKT